LIKEEEQKQQTIQHPHTLCSTFFLQFVISQVGGTEEVKNVVVKMDYFFMIHVFQFSILFNPEEI
jgi:hypothetical protein